MLKKSASCIEISFLRRNKVLKDILFGPETLLELRENMMLPTSSLLVGFRLSEKCLYEYFMLFLVVSAIEAE